jgi:hypothetical protein
MIFLDELVRGCDQRIYKNKKRAEKDLALSEEALQQVASIENQIKKLNELCIQAAENGDIDSSQEYSNQVDILKLSMERIANPKDVKHTSVCEVINGSQLICLFLSFISLTHLGFW